MKTQTEGQIGLTKTTTHLGKIGEKETETTIGTITTIIKQGITTTEAIMTKMNQGTTITGTDTTKNGHGRGGGQLPEGQLARQSNTTTII